MKIFLLMLTALLVSACASTPKFDTSQVNFALTPSAVTGNLTTSQHQKVLWGGVIINTSNLQQHTVIELLAYPLDSSYLPLREQKPLGRFLIRQSSFLEPSEYAQGRMVTVLGTVDRLQKGNVGETIYLYPEIGSQQLHLWPKDSGQSKTRFSFGIGVRL
ncbi:MAG: Slp family lipoprotein [Gammaproteobacteria bacterium]|nr:Slp family lipoprotein [Gammaproteobacteria bacterium]